MRSNQIWGKKKAERSEGVFSIEQPLETRASKTTLSFSEAEVIDIRRPHCDTLAINISVTNLNVKRVLVENGSSANGLFVRTFQKMQLDEKRILKKNVSLVGFSGEMSTSKGEIDLPVYGDGVNLNTTFLLVSTDLAYNIILGRQWIHAMRALPSSFHQIIKFSTKWGIFQIKGDQGISRECYYNSLKPKKEESQQLQQKQEEPSPAEDQVDEISLDEDGEKKILIGTTLDPWTREELIAFLKRNTACFA